MRARAWCNQSPTRLGQHGGGGSGPLMEMRNADLSGGLESLARYERFWERGPDGRVDVAAISAED